MDILRIQGGRRLEGELEVGGSKNAALAILAGCLLSKEDILLRNLPNIIDVRIKVDILKQLGVRTTWTDEGLWLNAGELTSAELPSDACRRIRTSFFLLGPILARVGTANVPLPGGCNIGARPVNFHVRGLKAMGATLEQKDGYYVAKASRLTGADIYLDFPSAGATQHLMTAAVLADGATSIHNCAMEPEVVELANFLNMMGARVDGAGTSTITIEGVRTLTGGDYRIGSDRLQAGTYLMAAAATRGELTVRALMPERLHSMVAKMRESGAEVNEGYDWVSVTQSSRPKAVDIRTMPHPGFPTDMQQPMCAYLATADGVSIINETIYEARVGHVKELVRMGADIRVDGRQITISGVGNLEGASVSASDLRAGAALIVAALGADGDTMISGTDNIDRGYENLEQILNSLGAKVERLATKGSEEAVTG